MPQSLRSILGKSRVTKPKPSRPAAPSPSSTSPRKSPAKKPPSRPRAKQAEDNALFPDKFTDLGIITTLLEHEELTLRDVVQAMRYIRSRMFTTVPRSGFTSTRTAELLNYRVSVPPLVTLGHVNAVLTSAPARVEREIVELVDKGVLRKVRVDRRGGMGEALIEVNDLENVLRRAVGVSEGAKAAFATFLKANPTAQTVRSSNGDGTLEAAHVDELVRAGFLTSSTAATPGTTLQVRPEDRTTLTSIQHVSRFASGTVSAVGGQNAIHEAGGGGGAPALYRRSGDGGSSAQAAAAQFRLAVPGHGRYLKLADAAVDWLREALGRTKWGEGPESWLRERLEGGGLYGARWKEFWGVEWEWVLGQAVGLGVVEVFETGSVGRGVRALGG